MENFVLNLFSDQLSKVILNYHDARMKINASFMAGKGSITNVKLNVDLLNQLLNEPPHGLLPYLRLKEATITELRLEVTSYTNLKKAPVVLVIDEVFVEAEEMMEYYFDGKHNDAASGVSSSNAPANDATNAQTSKAAQKPAANQTAYGLLHRITDNLSVRINKIHISFQPLGKFKTRRVGVWTPPGVNLTLEDVEWISVTQYGEVGTPEQIWAHNDLSAQQANIQNATRAGGGHHHRMYSIFKRLSFKAAVGLVDATKAAKEQTTLISDCKIDAHVAYTRRLRDAGITGIDVDVLCHDADINLDLSENLTETPLGCSFQSVLHLMVGLQHCMYKDRSFVDPLLPVGVSRESTKQNESTRKYQQPSVSAKESKEIELGPDDFMPTINMEEDELDESSEDEEEPDEEHDEAFLAWKKEQGIESDTPPNDSMSDLASRSGEASSGMSISQRESSQSLASKKAAPNYKRKRKAVIVLASGAQKFEKLSFSLTMRRVNVKLFLPSSDNFNSQMQDVESTSTVMNRYCIEIMTEGATMECMWPKPNGEIGGNVQCTLRYVHIMESVHQFAHNQRKNAVIVRYLPLMKIGSKLFDGQDLFSLVSHWNSRLYNGENESKILDDDQDGFPMMEKRQVSWKWSRHGIKGSCAVSLKSTVSFVEEKLVLWSKTFVVHEASIGEIEVCVDSDPIGRLVEAICSAPWDDRWLTGDYMNEITSDMMVNPEWTVSAHDLQPIPSWYGSAGGKLSSLSSDLRSVTARFGGIIVRMPSPVYSFSSCGTADVICSVSSATILVTSQLPAGFLTGTITDSDGEATFPNDKHDFSCQDIEQLISNTSNTFRMQITLLDFSLKAVPIPLLTSATNDDHSNYLIAPTKITSMLSLQHSDSILSNYVGHPSLTSQFLQVSVLIQSLQSNAVIERALCVSSTLNYHLTGIMRHAQKRVHCHPTAANNAKLAVAASSESSTMVMVVCLHTPEISLNLSSIRADQSNALKLCSLKLRRMEFGAETTCVMDEGCLKTLAANKKCIIGGLSIQTVTKNCELVDLVTIGIQSLIKDSSSESEEESIMMRACQSLHDPNLIISTIAVDVSSPLSIQMNIDAIQTFYDVAIKALTAPVYFYTKSGQDRYETYTQSTMTALLSIIDTSAPLTSPAYVETFTSSKKAETIFTRLLISNVSVQISDTAAANTDARFLLSFNDVDLIVGRLCAICQLEHPIFTYQCGRGDHWQNIVGEISTTDTFYSLKSGQSLVSIDECNKDIIPAFSIDWNSIQGDEKVKNMIDTSISIGTLMSYLGMKLYFMIPGSSSKARVASSTRELHGAIAKYHSRMLGLLSITESKIEQLRLLLFSKERERVGMMAISTPIMSGWLRICEGSLSSNRLFSTATLFRYWVVLSNSLLICYETPGTIPSLVFPISPTTSMRVITIPSASTGSSIVGNHLEQKGFALVESISGTEIFCISKHRDEFEAWVSAISCQLKDSSTEQPEDFVVKERHDIESPQSSLLENEGSVEASGAIVSTSDAFMPDIVSDTQVLTSQVPDSNHDDIDDMDLMDTISLTGSDENPSVNENVDSADTSWDQHEARKAEQGGSSTTQHDFVKLKASTLSSTRDLIKTSRFASSRLNSALKSAKEKGRDSVQNRAELGQKFSGLRQNANMKISQLSTVVKTSVQEHSRADPRSFKQVDPALNSGLETLGSESQVLDFPNNIVQPNRQEQMKKKLANLDQSMSTTMRRLKLDEKLNSISTAVKHAATEGQVVARQISSTGSISQLKSSEQRQQKSIKMDARETFLSHSDLPVRVKTIKAGHPLVLHSDDYLREKSQSLEKIKGAWYIDVTVHEEYEVPIGMPFSEVHSDTTGRKQLKFKITSTEIGSGTSESVSKSLSEILVFNALISEAFSSYDYAAEVTYREETNGIESMDLSFHKLTSLERIRVVASMLQGILDTSNLSDRSPIQDSHCEVVKIFMHTLVSTYMTLETLKATEDFLGITNIKVTDSMSRLARDNINSPAATLGSEITPDSAKLSRRSSINSLASCSTDNPAFSCLIDAVMSSYSKAIQERDEAVAKLSASSIIKENAIIQKYLEIDGMSQNSAAKPLGNSDEELQMLCKNLGQEIEMRTAAEQKVEGLKQQMELERSLAASKELELKAQLEKYKLLLSKGAR